MKSNKCQRQLFEFMFCHLYFIHACHIVGKNCIFFIIAMTLIKIMHCHARNHFSVVMYGTLIFKFICGIVMGAEDSINNFLCVSD